MANHKLTLLGHPASKKIQLYLQHADLQKKDYERRLAYSEGIVALSGEKGRAIDLARDLYKIDLNSGELRHQFETMIQSYGFQKATKLDAHVCAEAHLWMTLVGLHSKYVRESQAPRHRYSHPRHAHIWVYEIDGKFRPKEDSPCPNCQQWVRKEFCTVNGTS